MENRKNLYSNIHAIIDSFTVTMQNVANPLTSNFLSRKVDKPEMELELSGSDSSVIKKRKDICKKLARYLSWCGFNTKVFNVGNRRRVVDNVTNPSETGTSHDAKFFDHSNAEASSLREKVALETLGESIEWLRQGGKVAIHDATNSTVARRQALRDRVSQETEIHIKAFFIESICPNQELLEQNIRMKLQGPDYIKMDPEEALKDFRSRISNYEKVYQTISEEEEDRSLSYIKIVDVGNKVIAHRIRGYLPSQCVFYLMQMHIVERTIWLTRHGESMYNMAGRLGGDSELSANGKKYSEALFEFIENREKLNGGTECDRQQNDSMWSLNTKREALRVFTSTLRRTLETAEHFEEEPDRYEVSHIKFLNEIYAGSFEELTYEEIKSKHPDEYLARQEGKLQYRYPGAGGESYLDVIERLRPVIIELERMRVDALVVTHQVVMRTLLAYFTGIPLCDVPKVKVPLHTLYCLQPKPYGADLHRYVYDPASGQITYQGEGYEFV
ncbi:hypothetical protein HDV01_001201 [Terramyces sp. JEL0728]|nr:hypothetical protein HDV01_001201 [Terramyces sp. JEL0728]